MPQTPRENRWSWFCIGVLMLMIATFYIIFDGWGAALILGLIFLVVKYG